MNAIEQEIHANLTFLLLNEHVPLDICLVDQASNTIKVIVPAGKRIGKRAINQMVKYRHQLELAPSPIRDRIRYYIQAAEQKAQISNDKTGCAK